MYHSKGDKKILINIGFELLKLSDVFMSFYFYG